MAKKKCVLEYSSLGKKVGIMLSLHRNENTGRNSHMLMKMCIVKKSSRFASGHKIKVLYFDLDYTVFIEVVGVFLFRHKSSEKQFSSTDQEIS